MRVALICRDKPGHLQTRLDNRAAHLEHIKTSGVVEMAGPFLNPEGQMTGSLVVLEVETLDEAALRELAGDICRRAPSPAQ